MSESDVCYPITSLDALLTWKPDPSHSWVTSILDKAPTASYKIKGYGFKCHMTQNTFSPLPRVIKHTAPKTIVCHDFKGGYQDDKYPNGTTNNLEYTFFHWNGIDTFIYFSHYLVTIPPCGWINAGHKNGVSVLGTFITEHEEGTLTLKKILENERHMRRIIEKLVQICKFYNFDGYLLNIESDAPQGAGYELARFVSLLKTQLVTDCGPDTMVIWYDALSYNTCKVQWQNKLNDANKKFFDCCDGIFLNYMWKPDELCISAAAAGARQQDVYVGVDVFGRDCYGGGGYETHKAMEKIRQAGLSVALFGIAWTHEVAPNPKLFLWRELFFWHKIWKYLYIHGPSQIPFSTSFCIGRGMKSYSKGRTSNTSTWFNLSEQDPQLCTPYCITEYDCEDLENFSARCIRSFDREAFIGGNCLMITRPSGLMASQHCFVRLMLCEFKSDKKIIISVSLKPLDTVSSLSLVLLLEDKAGRLRRQILASETAFKFLVLQSETVPHIKNLFVDPNMVLSRVHAPPVNNENNWVTHKFDVLTESTILEIGVLHLGVCAVLLGAISVSVSQDTAAPAPT